MAWSCSSNRPVERTCGGNRMHRRVGTGSRTMADLVAFGDSATGQQAGADAQGRRRVGRGPLRAARPDGEGVGAWARRSGYRAGGPGFDPVAHAAGVDLRGFATFAPGAIVVSVYQTNSPEECHYVLHYSRARAMLFEAAEPLAKVRAVEADLRALEFVIVIDPADADGSTISLAALRACASRERSRSCSAASSSPDRDERYAAESGREHRTVKRADPVDREHPLQAARTAKGSVGPIHAGGCDPRRARSCLAPTLDCTSGARSGGETSFAVVARVCVRHHRSAARTGLVDANGWRTSATVGRYRRQAPRALADDRLNLGTARARRRRPSGAVNQLVAWRTLLRSRRAVLDLPIARWARRA